MRKLFTQNLPKPELFYDALITSHLWVSCRPSPMQKQIHQLLDSYFFSFYAESFFFFNKREYELAAMSQSSCLDQLILFVLVVIVQMPLKLRSLY